MVTDNREIPLYGYRHADCGVHAYMRYVLSREQLVPRSRPEVFAFFADAANLDRLTPRNLKFSIQTSLPIAMRPGAIIEYRLSLFRFPFRWRTVIEVFEPGSRFIDVQANGPYALWRHLHEFVDAAGGTLIRDRVEYALPLGPLGELAHALFVRRQLEQIFDFRRGIIEQVFAREQDMPPQPAEAIGTAGRGPTSAPTPGTREG